MRFGSRGDSVSFSLFSTWCQRTDVGTARLERAIEAAKGGMVMLKITLKASSPPEADEVS
jgi:hypothetical protein